MLEAEDFRGRISQNKRPSFDWIVSKLKYNKKKNTWTVHNTSEYWSDSGAIAVEGNNLVMFNLRMDLFNSVFSKKTIEFSTNALLQWT